MANRIFAHHPPFAARTMTDLNKTIVLIFLSFILTSFSWAESIYPFDTPKEEAQFDRILRSLRCLVCQNQDLADSNAPFAKDLRQEIYTLVKNRQSDQFILGYLGERYGEFIFFNPAVSKTTYFLWFGPIFFFIIGLVIFYKKYIFKVPS